MLAACGVLTMGCSSHLLFVEEGHIGLKAKFESNSPTPAQVTLGSHRGMMAVVPQQSKDASPRTQPPTVTASIDDDKHKILTIEHDPDELMSMYSTFCANIGFNDPVEVHHFLATGTAAVTLLSNQELLRDLTKELDRSACKAPPKDEEKGPKGGEE
jgi:hypothetical protein